MRRPRPPVERLGRRARRMMGRTRPVDGKNTKTGPQSNFTGFHARGPVSITKVGKSGDHLLVSQDLAYLPFCPIEAVSSRERRTMTARSLRRARTPCVRHAHGHARARLRPAECRVNWSDGTPAPPPRWNTRAHGHRSPAYDPAGQDSQRQPPVEAPTASRARVWDHCPIRSMIGQ